MAASCARARLTAASVTRGAPGLECSARLLARLSRDLLDKSTVLDENPDAIAGKRWHHVFLKARCLHLVRRLLRAANASRRGRAEAAGFRLSGLRGRRCGERAMPCIGLHHAKTGRRTPGAFAVWRVSERPQMLRCQRVTTSTAADSRIAASWARWAIAGRGDDRPCAVTPWGTYPCTITTALRIGRRSHR